MYNFVIKTFTRKNLSVREIVPIYGELTSRDESLFETFERISKGADQFVSIAHFVGRVNRRATSRVAAYNTN